MTPQRAARFRRSLILILLCALSAGLIGLSSRHGHAADSPLLQAAAAGDIDMVKTLLRRRADVNAKDKDGRTALSNAPTVEVVDALIAGGADVNATDNDGRTPLMHACWEGANLIVAKLLASGANVNAQDSNGVTPLIVASLSGRSGRVVERWSGRLQVGIMSAKATDIVEVLIKHGASVNARTKYGGTALMEAAFNGRTQIVKYLIDRGADVHIKNNDGMTALAFAKKKGHTDVVQLLERVGTVKAQSAAPKSASTGTATKVYLDFRAFVKAAKYREAFVLLDDTAKSEIRTVAVVLLGAAGIPSSKVNTLSDFELFKLFMSNQTPHQFQIISERIDGDMAVLSGRVIQGPETQPIEIKLKRSSGKWLIHSTGVAFGP